MEFKNWLLYAAVIMSFFALMFTLIQEEEAASKEYSFIDMYNSTDDSFTVPISTADVFYNLTGGLFNVTKGSITQEAGVITINNPGFYSIDWTLSFSGGNNNRYVFTMGKNYNPVKACTSFRSTSGNLAGNVGGNCIIYLYSGDKLNFLYKDEANPTADMEFYSLSISVFEH